MIATSLAASVLTNQHAYVVFTVLLCVGLYMMIADEHLVKKIIGLNLFQTGIFLFFIASAYVEGGSVPIIPKSAQAGDLYVSPLPHVLVLTAIVVGVSLTAVGLALSLRIYQEYGTLRVDALRDVMRDEGTFPGETEDEATVAGDGGTDPAAGAGTGAGTDGGESA